MTDKDGPTYQFTMNFPLKLKPLLEEECHKRRTNRKDLIIEALISYISKSQPTAIGVVYDKDNLLGQQQLLQPTAEEKDALVIKKLVNITNDALPIIIYMERDEFEDKVKGPVIDTIYKRRAEQINKDLKNKRSSQRNELLSSTR